MCLARLVVLVCVEWLSAVVQVVIAMLAFGHYWLLVEYTTRSEEVCSQKVCNNKGNEDS